MPATATVAAVNVSVSSPAPHVSVTNRPVRVTARSGVQATVSVATGPRGRAPWVALTQAEYDATQREAGTLYLITDRVGP